jgi:hypothetical protein
MNRSSASATAAAHAPSGAAFAAAATAAAVCLLIAIYLHKEKVLPTVEVVLMLIAGTGFGGALLHFLRTALGWTHVAEGKVTALIFGTSVVGLVALWFFLHVGHSLHPKKKPGRAVPWMALLLPLFLATLPGPLGALAAPIVSVPAELANGFISG